MKQAIIFVFLIITLHGHAQNYILPDGEYMDTTTTSDTACKDYIVYYYQVGGKYLESSITVLQKAQVFLQHANEKYNGSGYITFRFRIDCAGKRTKRTQVLQTNEAYKAYHFDKGFINELFLFLNTLTDWKTAPDHHGGSFSYIAFITFKIKDGKVINIIP